MFNFFSNSWFATKVISSLMYDFLLEEDLATTTVMLSRKHIESCRKSGMNAGEVAATIVSALGQNPNYYPNAKRSNARA
jgi:hypothetical protein